MKIVIIDDNEMTRSLLRIHLTSEKLSVAGEASTAKAGFEVVARCKPNLVFLDFQLPDGTGLEVLRTLKKAIPGLLVIMVTGEAGVETIKACLDSGANGYIIKPFTAATVSKVIANAVKRAATPS